jgi:Rhodopirellula transposase DDE domain
VNSQTAGSPTDINVKWTHLTAWQIARYLKETYGYSISCKCIRRILKETGYVKRKPLKAILTGKSPHRDEQFRLIAIIRAVFLSSLHDPMLSIDTKKKELLGNLTRNKAVYCKKGQLVKVFDHDYTNLATGKAVPHGIYDIKLNKAYVTLGNNAETADFIIDNLTHYWINYGIHLYPKAKRILILCDAGGANSYKHHRFKFLLQQLAKSIGVDIMVVHYPPYCSKYNPIERMLFAQIQRAMGDCILTDLAQFKDIILKTSTKKGLTVEVNINLKKYEIKQVSDPTMINQNKIKYAEILPQFNYCLVA